MKVTHETEDGLCVERSPYDYTLINVLAEAEKSGDTFLYINEALDRCERANRREHEGNIMEDFLMLLGKGWVVEEDGRLYRRASWRYENAVAKMLAIRLKNNDLPIAHDFDAALCAAEAMIDVSLDDFQRNAIRTCMAHRITIVTGGAGAGKTSMVRALHLTNKIMHPRMQTILCAPTGRAARNMEQKTDHAAHTIHRALGKTPNADFIGGVSGLGWSTTNMVVVDEASMLTLEMFAGILDQANHNTRIVLVGDPNQLAAVGAGNIINDLLELGVSHVHLGGNHRQGKESGALLHNVQEFNGEGSVTLEFDENFQLVQAYSANQARKLVDDLYADAILEHEEVQVLSPFRVSSAASAYSLNRSIQKRVNPPRADVKQMEFDKRILRGSDKVVLNENYMNFCNGDVGTLYFEEGCPGFFVDFGYSTGHFELSQGGRFDLAYAITIHRAQGSEYGTVILPILRDFGVMLNRHLLYTAISRAKTKLIIVGEEDAIEKALRTPCPSRNSTLVERVRQLLAG